MIVCTSTIRYFGPDRLDITVKSGVKSFAPTWDMVMKHKRGEISDTQYTDRYLRMMRTSYLDNKNGDWSAILNRRRVVLCCYCAPGNFCHRHLLKDILRDLCRVKNIEFVDGGEI